MIELQAIFTELRIRFWTSGKNCAPGWVNITCPFCNDHSNHLGVNIESGAYHCWKCDSTGTLIDLLYNLTDMSIPECSRYIKQYTSKSEGLPEKKKKNGRVDDNTLLPPTLPFLPELHRRYLLSRKFDPDELVQKYKIRASGITGKYKYRIIIPIIFNDKVVNFTALDVTGKSSLRYEHCPNEKAIVPMKDLLYNFDTVEKSGRIIVCEGVTDVWRMGEGTVATFGTQFTPAQIRLIINRGITAAFVLYDSDASGQGQRLAEQLAGIISQVENIELDEGDPGVLSATMVRKIRRWVWGK